MFAVHPRSNSLVNQVRAENLFGYGVFLSAILWVVTGAIPVLGLLVGDLVAVLAGGETPYVPPFWVAVFILPWWAVYLQTLLVAGLVVMSMPLPLRASRSVSRGTLLLVQSLVLGSSLYLTAAVTAAATAEGNSIMSFMGLDYLALFQFFLLLVTVVRMVMGWVHLLPRRWRVYVDDQGQVMSPKEVRQKFTRTQTRKPWYGRNRL